MPKEPINRLLDPLTFQKAQEIMALRRENRNVRQNPANRYPFSGLIFCPRCGKNYRRVTYKGACSVALFHLRQLRQGCLPSQTDSRTNLIVADR